MTTTQKGKIVVPVTETTFGRIVRLAELRDMTEEEAAAHLLTKGLDDEEGILQESLLGKTLTASKNNDESNIELKKRAIEYIKKDYLVYSNPDFFVRSKD